jgi:hypothetical protein
MKKERLSSTHHGDSLTRLQVLAVEFIRKCKDELKEHGIFIRSAEELEFITQDAHGAPAYDSINIPAFRTYLQNDLPHHVERFDYENTKTKKPFPRMQYELNIADPADIHHFNRPDLYDIAGVAMATNHAKQVSIKQALLESSCLTKPGRAIQATFHARPFYLSEHTLEDEFTSAMHPNISFFTAKGINLFAKSPELFNACAQALALMQHKAGITMLPTDASLTRIAASTVTPDGIRINHKADMKEITKVSVNKRIDSAPIAFVNKTRIENRLPGADADPIVAMAITLAAYMQPLRDYIGNSLHMPDPQELSLPDTHDMMAKRFTESHDLQRVLGKEFYNAIVSEYCQPQAIR